ncbi:conserved fungal protein [Moniliophthora roreri MCA 2997]|uniref:Conserved fungal protein n=2 Tax=Moniliophthora roreri TaxID=221103 RepID=V2WVJ5_MONRO|nr:conserved fungal protein [Moniliophthora roreri MCA 2997]KAI3604581.1 hypothetical protein WG66_008416 [Moniliophthora roreri]
MLILGFLLSVLHIADAVNVYLSPEIVTISSQLSPEDASAALSHHLGLEMFESAPESLKGVYDQVNFVAQGQAHALLLTMEDSDAKGILPSSLRPSFKLSTPPSLQVDSLSSVISTYLHRARHSYSSIYESLLSNWDASEVQSVHSFIRNSQEPVFAALDLSTLSRLREESGPESSDYTNAVQELRSFMDQLVNDERVHLAVLTYSSTPTVSYSKRQASQVPLPPNHVPPQQPISSISTCFGSVDTCNNATSACSGRGQCVKATKLGRTCFICACATTKTGEGNKVKTEKWVGERCERKDVSSSFVLFAGTAIVMIVLAIGSISLLYGVGEQSLPPTLTGTAISAKKD